MHLIIHLLKKFLHYVQKYLQQVPSKQVRLHMKRWHKKYLLLSGLFLLVLIGLRHACRPRVVTLQGEAMGTHYCIKYLARWGRSYQAEVEALLTHLHQALSLSLPDSELSRFNAHDCSTFYFASPAFYPVFAKSKEVYRNTAGAFDPTILPLVEAWEECKTEAIDRDSRQVHQRCAYVSLDYVVANEQRIKKLKEGVKLDFRGILKGYAVDEIAALLRNHGVERAWISLGSETVAVGKPSKGKFWDTALHPHLSTLVGDNLQITLELVDRAVAISGLQAKGSSSPGCIVDPATGDRAHHTLLAAAVVAQDCMAADAYATAMMVRGLVYVQELLAKETALAAFLVYEDEDGVPAFYASPGLHMQQNGRSITLRLAQVST